ncbi:MAG TPA: hypothetical protein VFS39_15025 [Nitrospira sp.]|nr:hypothetical protein [Nitrospira sp.]
MKQGAWRRLHGMLVAGTLSLTWFSAAVFPQSLPCVAVVDKPADKGKVWLAWDGTAEQFRIDYLNQTSNQWVALLTVPGTQLDAQVPLASSGKRLYRVCAVVQGKSLCGTKGAWASR